MIIQCYGIQKFPEIKIVILTSLKQMSIPTLKTNSHQNPVLQPNPFNLSELNPHQRIENKKTFAPATHNKAHYNTKST